MNAILLAPELPPVLARILVLVQLLVAPLLVLLPQLIELVLVPPLHPQAKCKAKDHIRAPWSTQIQSARMPPRTKTWSRAGRLVEDHCQQRLFEVTRNLKIEEEKKDVMISSFNFF